jgi:hypothetical protein
VIFQVGREVFLSHRAATVGSGADLPACAQARGLRCARACRFLIHSPSGFLKFPHPLF